MNANPTPHASAAAPAPESASERRSDCERRLDEAADVLAETLLDMWLSERRSVSESDPNV